MCEKTFLFRLAERRSRQMKHAALRAIQRELKTVLEGNWVWHDKIKDFSTELPRSILNYERRALFWDFLLDSTQTWGSS